MGVLLPEGAMKTVQTTWQEAMTGRRTNPSVPVLEVELKPERPASIHAARHHQTQYTETGLESLQAL